MSLSKVALAALFLSVSSLAYADPIEDRVRLTLDAAPLAISSTTVGLNVDTGLGGSTEQNETETNQLTVGIAPSFGASVGYGIDPQFLIGLRANLTSTTSTQDGPLDSEITTALTTIMLLPYVTYVGGDEESSVRFTATLMAGIASAHVRVGGGGARSTTGGAIGGSIGFLGFAAERFSMDPSLFVLFEAGNGGLDGNSSSLNDYSYSGTTLGVLVSFSGWLGEDKPAAPIEQPVQQQWASAPTTTRENPADAVVGPARPAPKLAVLSTRTTLDSAIFTLLGAPEQRGPEVALRIQRYAPAGEPLCDSLDVELDGTVAKTIPLKQSVRDDHGVQEITVQGSIDVELADRMAKARVAKLRWCGNERTLSLAARDGISRFIASMRGRLEKLPPLEAPAAPPEEAPAPAPAPTPTTPAPAPATTPAPAATP